MRSWLVIVVASLATAAAWAQVNLTEDPPVTKVQTGEINGTISPAKEVGEIHAVSRSTRKTWPATFDKVTGKFTVKGLPGDQAYDICIQTPAGRLIEGIDLSPVDERVAKLAAERRQQLGLPPATTHVFDDDDVKWMLDYAKNMEDFMDIRRVLYVQGAGKRATMLVELLKGDNFFAAKGGEVIWRVEIWYFEYQYGGWEQIPNSAVVLRRQRVPAAQWQKIHIEYFPELSVRLGRNGYAKPIDFKIPEQGDLSRGRLPNTEPNAPAAPHIGGVGSGAASSQPATMPGR